MEERKNDQIDHIKKSHEKAFNEIKNYYNDITLNNLALINSLKQQIEEMKKKEDRLEKAMAEVMVSFSGRFCLHIGLNAFVSRVKIVNLRSHWRKRAKSMTNSDANSRITKRTRNRSRGFKFF